MNSEIDDIIKKARELAQLVKRHSATVRYREDLKRLRGDEQSLQLYSKLVQMGKEITERASRGEDVAMEDSEQNRVIRDELENNEPIKSFIRSQRAYLELIQKVTDRIRNPKRD